MKIASYNIMSGGFTGYDHDQAVPQRLSEIQTAIRELDADIVGLIDTFRWEEILSAKQLYDLFGYEHAMSINLNDERLRAIGHNNGLTLMSKLPWQSYEVLKLGTRDAIKATFESGGKETIVILAYLDDLKEDVRLEQIKEIINSVAGSGNVLIMGDLNTIAPSDKQSVIHELEIFYANNPGIKDKLAPVVEQMQQGKVIEWLEARGFVDAGIGTGSTMPTKLFAAAVAGPFLRVDYCFHGPGLKVNSFRVHTTNIMQKTSDHFPISFTVA